MLSWAITRLLEGHDLTRAEARDVMGTIMRGEATPAQIGGFLVALRAKGETAEEIAGCAEAMREHALAVRPARDDLVDTAGTGGDNAGTLNISTAAALVAAAAGAAVAKHGNRAVSSASGSADVLEALGFELELPPERIARSIDELGFGFLFAPAHHPAMKHAAPVRRELATRTVFNVLGPLTNPAGARAQVVGVFAPELVRTLAEVLAQLGAWRAFVVHGKASPVHHDGQGLFTGLPPSFDAGRYHSLAATRVPDELEVSATCAEGEVMAVRHRELPVDGVQFHPESVLTPNGRDLARNFLEGAR